MKTINCLQWQTNSAMIRERVIEALIKTYPCYQLKRDLKNVKNVF